MFPVIIDNRGLVACGLNYYPNVDYTGSRMNTLSVGASEQDVIALLGAPGESKAVGDEKYLIYAAQWHCVYDAFRSALDGCIFRGSEDRRNYFVRLVNGQVASFGRWGDFSSTKDPTLNQNITIQQK